MAKKRYIRKRYNFFNKLLKLLLLIPFKYKYKIKYDKVKDDKKRAYLVLFNHQTADDQFFVTMMFHKHVFFVASEDIFSNGFISKLLRFVFGPIPFKKSTSDIHAVRECMYVAKEGGTIAISPEGNRTYSGETGYIKPAISKFAKALKLPIMIVNIKGGYGVRPRFSNKIRRGPVKCNIKRIIETDEYLKMSDDELLELIRNELYVDESYSEIEYKSKHHAEYLERVIYVCPKCGLSEFASHGDNFKCLQCGYSVNYNGHNTFNEESQFRSVKDWYRYQEEYISSIDIDKLSEEEVIYKDNILLQEVIIYKRKKRISKNTKLALFKNRVELKYNNSNHIFLFDDISAVSVLGRNKCNIYYQDKLYQVKGNKRFNPVKYMNFYYHYKNKKEGIENVNRREFLGL